MRNTCGAYWTGSQTRACITGVVDLVGGLVVCRHTLAHSYSSCWGRCSTCCSAAGGASRSLPLSVSPLHEVGARGFTRARCRRCCWWANHRPPWKLVPKHPPSFPSPESLHPALHGASCPGSLLKTWHSAARKAPPHMHTHMHTHTHARTHTTTTQTPPHTATPHALVQVSRRPLF